MKKILIVASSLDGYIASSREQSAMEWTSQADKEWFGKISREIGVILVGRATYETFAKPLKERTTVVMTRDQDFEAAEIEMLAAGENGDKWAGGRLYKTGEKTPEEIVKVLEGRGVEQMAICGGARVYQMFLEADLIDELYITIEPIFLGEGIKLMGGGVNLNFPMRYQVVEKFDLSINTSVWHLGVTSFYGEVRSYPRIFEWLDSIKNELARRG